MPDDNGQMSAPVDAPTPSLPTVAPADDNSSAPVADVPEPTVDAPVPTVDTSEPTADVPEPVKDVSEPMNPATMATPMMEEDKRPTDGGEIPSEVIQKIGESKNVLVALSSDPSVDEMAAAIGLTLFLDKLGKRATAIYSGSTPNALEFLKPEETFEPSVDTLQDFVIALNKDKADHLRYKLDGDYVKIYITPYKTKIKEDDLEFSYGDFNVDLVLALNVANGIDLDSALREHGRIMHDAVIVNITAGNPGRLGEIEWSDKAASSVSEMIARLLYNVKSEVEMEAEEATAFLTGIVAATDRFSNAKTTPETMSVASKLMGSGANQQLVSENITSEIENQLINMSSVKADKKEDNPTDLDIEHHDKEDEEEKTEEKIELEEPKETKSEDETEKEKTSEEKPTLLDDLKEAEESLAAASAEVTPEKAKEPLKINNLEDDNLKVETPVAPVKNEVEKREEKVIQPSNDTPEEPQLLTGDEPSKYGQMLEEALENADGGTAAAVPVAENPAAGDTSTVEANPAMMGAPEVAANPEINGVPEINYMPMPGDTVLPPPPTPPIDMDTPIEPTVPTEPVTPVEPITPAAPVNEPAPEPLGNQPAMQDQVYNPQAADPGAFKIPGM